VTTPGGADFEMLGLGIDASDAMRGAQTWNRAIDDIDAGARRAKGALGVVDAAFKAAFGFQFGSDIYRWVKDMLREVPRLAMESTRLAARYNELGIVLNVVGRNAGSSQRELDDLERSLRKTGISAIQSRQQILTMIQANLDLSIATKLARAAQDTAVVGQLNSSEALARLTRGIVTGETETLRTLGINVTFANSYKELAKQLGVAEAQLTAHQKTQVRANVVLKEAANITGAYEASLGAASKQLRTTERYVEDLKVEVGQVFQDAYTQLVFGYSDALKELLRWVVDNRDGFAVWARELGAFVHGVGAAIRVVVEWVRQLRAARDAMRANTEAGLGWLQVFHGFTKGAAGASDVVEGLNRIREGHEKGAAAADRYTASVTRANDALSGDRAYRQFNRTPPMSQAGADYLRGLMGAPGLGISTGREPGGPFGFGATIGFTGRGGGFTPVPRETPPPPVDPEAMRRAQEAIRAARDAFVDFRDSFRDLTPYEQFEKRLEDLRRKAVDAKLALAEVTQREAEARAAFRDQQNRERSNAAYTDAQQNKDALANYSREAGDRLRARLAEQRAIVELIQATRGEIGTMELTAEAMRREGKERRALLEMIVAEAKARELIKSGVPAAEAFKLATAFAKAQGAVADASTVTASWGDRLRDVGGLVTGILSLFRNIPDAVREAGAGLGGILSGVGTLGSLKNAKGDKLGILDALTGKGGAAAALSAVSGVAAAVGGVVQLMDAVDAFGVRARENARIMRENGRIAEQGTEDFRDATRALGGVADALSGARRELGALVGNAAIASFGPNAKLGGRGQDYVTQAAVDAFMAQAKQQQASGNFFTMAQGLRTQQFAKQLQEMVDAIAERARSLVPQVLGDIDRAYNAAFGDEVANQVADAAAQAQARYNDLATLLAAGALTAEAYAQALAKVDATFARTQQNIAEAERKAQQEKAQGIQDANTSALARLLGASGQGPAAEAIRRHLQNEQALREAREKGYDVALELAAQEAELAEQRQIEARRRLEFEGSLFARETALTNGSIAGRLAQKGVEVQQAVDAANADRTLSDADRKRIRDVGAGELEQLRAEFRRQYEQSIETLRLAFVKNPVDRATIEGAIAFAEGLTTFKDLFLAGIITQAEFDQAKADLDRRRQQQIDEAKRQQAADAAEFAVRSLERRAGLTIEGGGNGDVELRRQAFGARRVQSIETEIDGYERLVEAGTITQGAFDALASVLRASVTPALNDAAFAAAEAARTLQDNLGTLGQQFTVFGTNPDQQLTELRKFLDFEGKTLDEVKALFTKATPGVALTDTQRQQNDAVLQFVEAYNRAEEYRRSLRDNYQQTATLDDATREMPEQFTQRFTGLSEATALSQLDASYTMIGLLRGIERNTAASAGIPSTSGTTTGAAVAGASGAPAPSRLAGGIALTLNFYGDISGADAETVGTDLGRAALDVINRGLGTEAELDAMRLGY
jgi:hypothetical protein